MIQKYSYMPEVMPGKQDTTLWEWPNFAITCEFSCDIWIRPAGEANPNLPPAVHSKDVIKNTWPSTPWPWSPLTSTSAAAGEAHQNLPLRLCHKDTRNTQPSTPGPPLASTSASSHLLENQIIPRKVLCNCHCMSYVFVTRLQVPPLANHLFLSLPKH